MNRLFGLILAFVLSISLASASQKTSPEYLGLFSCSTQITMDGTTGTLEATVFSNIKDESNSKPLFLFETNTSGSVEKIIVVGKENWDGNTGAGTKYFFSATLTDMFEVTITSVDMSEVEGVLNIKGQKSQKMNCKKL